MKRAIGAFTWAICTVIVTWAMAAMNDWSVGNKIRIEQLLKNQKPLAVVILEGGLIATKDRGEGYLTYLLTRGPLSQLNAKEVLAKYNQLAMGDDFEAQRYFVSLFDGVSETKLQGASEKYFSKKLKKKIIDKVVALIETLKENGFDVFIVSSQPQYLAIAAGEVVGIDKDHIIAIQNGVVGGKLTINIVEPIPVGASAATAVKKVTDRQPAVVIGSSERDQHLLSAAEHLSIVINPDAPTRQIASGQGWITQFFQE